MMSHEKFDYIVIGAGIVGTCTAWRLSQKAAGKILLLEQFPIPNSRNSSSGHSRMYRSAYKQPVYCKMMADALDLWKQLEKISGEKLLYPCGLLCGGAENQLQLLEDVMLLNNSECQRFNFRDIKERITLLKNFSDDEEFVFDSTAGLIVPDKALMAMQRLLVADGGSVRGWEKVKNVSPKADRVFVQTSKQSYSAKAVVLAMGAWAGEFTASLGLSLPLQPTKVRVYYFRTKKEDPNLAHDRCPTMVHYLDKDNFDRHIYVQPEFEYPGCIKIIHRLAVPVDPNSRDQIEYKEEYSEDICNFVKKHFTSLDPEPAICENCIYTMSPDGHFILDYHSTHKNIVIGAGMSGHAFKMGPVIGDILSDLALGHTSSVDLTTFSIGRFDDIYENSKHQQ